MPRALATIQADIVLAHDAWVRSLQSEAYDQADSEGRSIGVKRAQQDKLYQIMMTVQAEYDSAVRGGVRVVAAVPVDG